MVAKFQTMPEAVEYADRMFTVTGSTMAVVDAAVGFKVIRYMSRIDKNILRYKTRRGVRGGGRPPLITRKMIEEHGNRAHIVIGCTRQSVRAAAIRFGITMELTRKIPTQQEIDAIKAMRAEGYGITAIANRFGRSRSFVHRNISK